MAYTRNTRYRRRYVTTTTVRRKRYANRRYRRSFPITRKLSDHTVYRFKRTIQLAAGITNSNSADTFGVITFQLSNLSNNTEFTNLFDQYQITGVLLRFVPSVQNLINPSLGDVGSFIFVPDYNDAVIPTAMSELYERQSSKIKYGANRAFTLFIRPKVAISIAGGFGPSMKNQWIDSTNPTVDYYGLKWGFRQAPTTTHIDVFATYYLKMRNVK